MKRNIKKILLSLLTIIIVSIISFIVYDRVTVNNQYYISEKNLAIPIFVYHDIVSDESEIKFDYMQTTKDTFEKQISGLQKIGYHFITYDDLEQYKNGQKKLYKKSCIITFDDGYEGVYENAYPIAQKYNIPMTMFIITDNMESQGVITWKQAEEMKNSGFITIASHSTNHPEFTKLTKEEAKQNVDESYRIIEEKLGVTTPKIFTYPYGLNTEEELQTLKEDGYLQNLTDNKVNESKTLDIYALHRCYPLSDSVAKILLKIRYRIIRYN